ncbi:HAMP domain-containing histidine kinase [Mucilaginibacter sp. 21P]|uniref:sensor histidine kinase n=1 Tax=Mucilaginibacter sp. 21P TaxID=2778902 RepID=UPI001C5818A0|nr:HAMP domain-containing sensor histidine kinase [Mucilaginibacter sp. 21P]QXV64694.1 HAMP domain-containing histidine kinase [Mucilaginibacter sp. 21P]
MKLINKLTYWIMGVVFLVTPFTMIISYRSIKSNINNAEIRRLKDVTDKVAEQLKAGQPPHQYILDRPITVKQVAALPAVKLQTKNYSFYNAELKRDECRMDVTSYYKINNKVYAVSTYNYITQGKQIIMGMVYALAWKIGLITLSVLISGRLVSKYILSSFKQTLKSIEQFTLGNKEKLVLPATSTAEFKELNSFLQNMTDRALKEYNAVKEFSENASHEVQTPLAVMRTKLELLSETEINAEQAQLIGDMQYSIEKLVKINRSLLLLTKLNNSEYQTTEKVKFCRIAKDMVRALAPHLDIKGIELRNHIGSNIPLQIHPVLAEILLNNLLGNAIRYNNPNGYIDITLTQHHLTIKNPGLAPEVDPASLFQRFKKSNQCEDSVGLGLSIVQQICAVNNFEVNYSYENEEHIICVNFDNEAVLQQPTTTVEETFVAKESILA